MKILLVDDDTEIIQLISCRLKKDNYIVEVATDGEYAIDLLQSSTYGLVVLDWMLPSMSGIDVCQALRNQRNQTPILMLTGQDHLSSKVTGLDAGADDYLVKPFELDELTARIRALLRRDSEVVSTVIDYGALQFNPVSQTLTFSGEPLQLRPKELAILELLLRYPTQVFEPDRILDHLWDLADSPGKATIKAHIRALRKRLDAAGARDVIETVYGQGYRLNPAFPGGCDRTQPHTDPAAEATALSNQAILEETWEQMQSLSWTRVSRLEELVEPYPPATDSGQLSQADPWDETRKTAVAIAHQLKGTLGSFGFQTASLQAKHIEALLAVSNLADKTQVVFLQNQVATLKQLVKGHMTASCPEGLSAAADAAHVLVVARDDGWAQTLVQSKSTVPVKLCSPLTINEHLLESTPSVIVLELSEAERDADLSLLDVLVSNYGAQVPILAVLESLRPDDRLVAIHHGASMVAQKTWSPQALLTVVGEHIAEYIDKPIHEPDKATVGV